MRRLAAALCTAATLLVLPACKADRPHGGDRPPRAAIPRPDHVARVIVADARVAVPRDFVAIHMHRWPDARVPGTSRSPPPTYAYGAVRSLNYDGILWYDLHEGPGRFAFDHLDGWVERHHRDGRTLVYTLYGTPRWASTRPLLKDLYQRPGGDSRPRDPMQAAEFVHALVARYNGDGRRRIAYLELWNEPDFVGGPYWRDSPAALASLARAVARAAKAADPGIRVLGPGFTDLFDGPKVFDKVVAFARAPDGAGGTGGDWIDGLAFHYYDYGRRGIEALMDTIEGMRMTRAALGRPDLPLYLTEIGAGGGWTDSAPPLPQKARRIAQWMAVAAAYGVRMVGLYSHESWHLARPAENREIAETIGRMGAALSGRVITDAALLSDGTIRLRFSDGRTLRV